MSISKGIVKETLERIEGAELVAEPLMEAFQKIREENPHLAEFIDAVLESWKEDPPSTLNDQLSVLFVDLMVLADMFRRQEEVDKLDRQFGR